MVMLEKCSLSSAMNARIVGTGERTMVLAHGFGADQTLWDKTLALLSKHFRVLVFDWLFSGSVKDQTLFDPLKYSSFDAFADDLIDLLDEMNLKGSIFVGHSMAGMIGCVASIKRPELFQRLVLVGASPRYINTEGYEGGFEASAIEAILKSIDSDYHSWATTFASLVVDPKDSDSVQRFEKCLKSIRPETALPLAQTVFGCDLRDVLDKVSIPCTIVQTENDIVVPRSVAYYMQEKIKGKSTVEIVDTHGHFPQLTAYVQLLDIIGGVLGF